MTLDNFPLHANGVAPSVGMVGSHLPKNNRKFI